MPEGDGNPDSSFVPRAELNMRYNQLNESIEENSGMIQKILEILYGNRKEGLIMTVQRLTWRNQYIDKGVSLIIGVLSAVITCFLIRWLGA